MNLFYSVAIEDLYLVVVGIVLCVVEDYLQGTFLVGKLRGGDGELETTSPVQQRIAFPYHFAPFAINRVVVRIVGTSC